MSSIFTMITNSFGMGNTNKKMLMDIFTSKYELQAKHEPVELKKILTDASTRKFFIKELSTAAVESITAKTMTKIKCNSSSLSSKFPLETLSNSNHNPTPIPTHHSTDPPTHHCTQPSTSPLTLILILKKLSTFHHLTIYYPSLSSLIEEINLEELTKSISEKDWLSMNIIKPYIRFIKKYCLSIEMYQKLRLMPNGNRDNIFESMCYAVNLFTSLFASVNKLSSMGRYFKPMYEKEVEYFVEVVAYHSQLIYQSFRSCIVEIVSFSQEHLSNKEFELIFKQILEVDLAWINEELKKVFLDKYFYPYGKGYGVRLYRIEDQNEYQVKIINGILNEHEETERKKNVKMMEEIVFPLSKLSKGMSSDELEVSFTMGLECLKVQQQQLKSNNGNNKNKNNLNKNNNKNKKNINHTVIVNNPENKYEEEEELVNTNVNINMSEHIEHNNINNTINEEPQHNNKNLSRYLVYEEEVVEDV